MSAAAFSVCSVFSVVGFPFAAIRGVAAGRGNRGRHGIRGRVQPFGCYGQEEFSSEKAFVWKMRESTRFFI